MKHWRENKSSQAFLNALSADVGIPTCRLIESSTTRSDRGGGTWIHPKAATHLAMWISPEFGVEVAEWVHRFISGDLTLVQDLVERHEAVHQGTQVLATLTTAGPEIDIARLSELHKDNAVEQENQRLNVRIAEILKNVETGEEELKEVRQERDSLIVENAKLVAEKKSTLLNHQLVIRNAKRAAARVNAEFEEEKAAVVHLRAQVNMQSQKAFDAAIEITELHNTLEQVQRQLNGSIFEVNRIHDAGTALYKQCKIGMATLQQISGDGTEFDSGLVGPTAEQPLASSKPTRYIGLHDVTLDSSGEHNRLIRDINRDTLDSIGQNLCKYFYLNPSTTKAAKVAMVESIVGYVFPANESHSFVSSVTCRTVVYSAVKARWKLVHSTYCTIGNMYDIVVRANAWARKHKLSGEFIMCQQRDLQLILGRDAPIQGPNARARMPRELHQSTILQHFGQAVGLIDYSK